MMNPTLLTDEQLSSAIRADLGLKGWRAACRDHPDRAGKIVVLTPPGFDPLRGDRPVIGRGPDQASAFADALARVGDRVRPRPNPRLGGPA